MKYLIVVCLTTLLGLGGHEYAGMWKTEAALQCQAHLQVSRQLHEYAMRHLPSIEIRPSPTPIPQKEKLESL